MPLRDIELSFSLNVVEAGGLQSLGVSRVSKNLNNGKLREGSFDTQTGKFVVAMLRSLSDVAASSEFAERIAGADIAVARSDLINACAVPSVDGPKIVIFSGLIKALMFMLEYGEIVATVSRDQKRLRAMAGLEEGEIEHLGYQAFTLVGHYAIWGTPLPRAWPDIGRNERASSTLTLSKVLWFVVSHELAHIALGHLDAPRAAENNLNVYPALALDEGINILKAREFEADEYIVQTLHDSVRNTFLSWALLPLQMFSSLERLLSNYNSTHPMAINRLRNLERKARLVGDTNFADVVDDVVARQLEAQEAYASSTRNMAFHSSHERAQDALSLLQTLARYATATKEATPAKPDPANRAWVWDLLMEHLNSDDE